MNEYSSELFSARLKESRSKLGLTQKQVCETAKISPASYSAYEQLEGKTPPLDIAFRIAEALNVSLDWLTGKESDAVPKTYQELAFLLMKLSMGVGLYIKVEEGVAEADAFNFMCTLKFVGFSGVRFCDEYDENSESVKSIRNEANNGTRFAEFLMEWKKIYKLFYLGTIGSDLYELWCSKEISKLKGDILRGPSLVSGNLNRLYDDDLYGGEGLILGGNS